MVALGIGYASRSRLCVLGSFFVALERCSEMEDGLSLLYCDHSARGERAAIADPIHMEQHGTLGVPGAEEVGVQGVRRVSLLDCERGGAQRLCRHLAAEQAS